MTRKQWLLARLRSSMLVLTSLIVALIVCEGFLRLFPPAGNVIRTATLGIFAPDAELRWVLQPNIRVRRNWAGRNIVIRTDADGHRIPDVFVSRVSAAEIAFAGDSYVFGNEIDAEETFVHRLGQSSRRSSVNLGVGGYKLSQECLALRRFMAQATRIVEAFLVIYVGNDIEKRAYPNRMLVSLLSDLGMSVIDLLPRMRSIAAERPSLWYDNVEGHLSPEGHRFVASILIDHLRPLFAGKVLDQAADVLLSG